MNNAPTVLYDPAEISIVFNGQLIEGYAADTFVTVARSNPMFEKTVGCDGIVARSKKNDKSGTIKLTLLHTSPSNDALSTAYLADEVANSGPFTFALKDNRGRTIVFALESWVTKPADVTYGSGIATREWEIETGDMDMTVGGY